MLPRISCLFQREWAVERMESNRNAVSKSIVVVEFNEEWNWECSILF